MILNNTIKTRLTGSITDVQRHTRKYIAPRYAALPLLIFSFNEAGPMFDFGWPWC